VPRQDNLVYISKAHLALDLRIAFMVIGKIMFENTQVISFAHNNSILIEKPTLSALDTHTPFILLVEIFLENHVKGVVFQRTAEKVFIS
jgi:hypothetical protein